ncbi:MAG: LysR family transcriptional regulator [Nocardiopsaceae bacterium]|nr:LysR family transcriptional regulator [Nocardiopsaceae bacterium]
MGSSTDGEVTFSDLEIFAAFARSEHFGQAARELGVSVPTVQRGVRALERKLDVVLVENAGRRVRLRHAGHLLAREAHTLLRARSEALRVVCADAGKPRRLLRVAHTFSLGVRFVPGVLAALLAEQPGLRLETRQEAATDVVSRVLRGDTDVAFTSISPAEPSIRIEPLFTEALLLAVPVTDPLCHADGVSLTDAAGRPFIAMSPGSSSWGHMMNACARAGFAPDVTAEASDLFGVESMVAAGLGVALVPERMSDYSHPGVVRLRIAEPHDIHRTIFLACPSAAASDDTVMSVLRIARRHGGALARSLPAAQRSGLPLTLFGHSPEASVNAKVAKGATNGEDSFQRRSGDPGHRSAH